MGLKQLTYLADEFNETPQVNLEQYRTKVDIAIQRIKHFEPPEGYWGAFSGGKDSQTIYDLGERAEAKIEWHFSMTTMDPPEVVWFIRDHYPKVSMDRPPETMWQLIPKKGMPRRNARWCCAELKERGGTGRLVLTGIRHAESTKRVHRKLVETCFTDTTKTFLHPIVDWGNEEVWEYLRERNLEYCSLYDEGASGKYKGDGVFQRIGCVLCPMTRNTEIQIGRWPKIAGAWERACYRLWDRHTKGTDRFPSPEVMWQWWKDRDSSLHGEGEPMMFD